MRRCELSVSLNNEYTYIRVINFELFIVSFPKMKLANRRDRIFLVALQFTVKKVSGMYRQSEVQIFTILFDYGIL